MTDETKVVGDITSNTRGSGARFNSGKPRLDLIPLVFIANTFNTDNMTQEYKTVHSILYFTGMFQETGDPIFLDQAMTAGKDYWADCAKVFEYGADKYSTRGDCVCEGGEKAKLYRASVIHEINMKKNYEIQTQNTESAKKKTEENGTSKTKSESSSLNETETKKDQLTQSIDRNARNQESNESMVSSTLNTVQCSNADASYAPEQQNCTSITTIKLEKLEEYFAIPATLALDFSKGLTIGLTEHTNTCNVHKSSGSGLWNWVKGMNWSVPIGCIGRHSLKVLAKNELSDDESGLLHMGHIMCNLVMLKAFHAGYAEGNDLPPKYFSVDIVK